MTIDEFRALDMERVVVIFPGHSSGWVDWRDGRELIVEFLSGEQWRVDLARLARYDHMGHVLFADGVKPPPPRPHLVQLAMNW